MIETYNNLSKSSNISRIKELNKLYLEEIKREIEEKRQKTLNDKSSSLKLEQALLENYLKETEETKRRKKIDEASKRTDLIHYLNEQINEKQKSNEDDKKALKKISNGTLIINSSDNNMIKYKEKSIRHSYLRDNINIQSDNNQQIQEKIDSEKSLTNSHNIHNPDQSLLQSNNYIYFKNKQLGQTGEQIYSDKQNMIDSVLNKYEQYKNNKQQHSQLDTIQSQSISSPLKNKERINLNYLNASQDVQLMNKYKKMQDQLLTRHMLNEQIKTNHIEYKEQKIMKKGNNIVTNIY